MKLSPRFTKPYDSIMTKGPLTQQTKSKVHRRIWFFLALIAVIDAVFLITILVTRAYPCDFEVYALAGKSILNQTGIYTTMTLGCHLQFTYPPFAVLLFIPFSLLGKFGFGVWTLLGAIALWRTIILILRVHPISAKWLSPAQQIAAVFLFVLPLEPFVKTLRYGQVNLFILWLITESFFGTNTRRSAIYSAFAWAIKLTPGLFTFFLVFVRGTRTLLVSLATFGITVIVGFALQRDQAWTFWSTHFSTTDRVGPREYIYNQSMSGVMWRLLGEGGLPVLGVLLAVLVIGMSFRGAKYFWDRGEQLWAVTVIGLASLLISPISWSHHYVLLLFPLMALAKDATNNLNSRFVLLATYLLLLLANVTFKVLPHGNHLEFNLNSWQEVLANQYVILVFLLLGFALLQKRNESRNESVL